MTHPDASILHDHYRDTFAHIREREKQRDRLFLVVIAILGSLVLQLSYTSAATALVSEVEVLGVTVRPSEVPMPALLSTTWTFLLALALRYCQITANIESQYEYIHTVERRLSDALGAEGTIARESTAYFSSKSRWFRAFAWRFYILLFPAVVIGATLFSSWMEWCETSVPQSHKLYDSAISFFVLVCIILYMIAVRNERPRAEIDRPRR